MKHQHRFALAAATVALFAPGVLPVIGTAQPAPDQLGKRDRLLLAEAGARGESTVTVLIAARPVATDQVANAVASVGGTVKVQDTEMDYVRALVPTDRVDQLAGLAGVEALDVDEIIPLPDPKPDGIAAPMPQTPPGSTTPLDNPYLPIADTGAAQFRTAHPTWDGRGVTVGIVDSGITLDHPSLQTTTTGERKIVDWVTYTNPETDNDPTWINMQDQVTARDGRFDYKGVSYTAPARNERYRIGLFDERDADLGGEVGNDVNRDGNPGGSSGIFAVLWNKEGDDVWVDANQNRSFDDELRMTDYRQRQHVGWFGTDNPATAVSERMPFVVQIERRLNFVNIGIVSAQHGSHVAGIVAGNSLFGGPMSGAAPGARLVSVRACLFIAGCTTHALIEGMIYAAKEANVDVINMSIGGLPALNDANNARAELYDRLIERFRVQMFLSSGNSGPGVNSVGDPSVATKVVSVGSYISAETWLRNYGSDPGNAENMHPFSSRGPREDGGFKPELIAPSAAISTTPLWQAGGPVAGTYALPPGYSMLNGTSMSSPQAAGAAALLVSAAKAEDVPHRPDQLRQSMFSSARLLDTNRFQVYEQGNGLIRVGAAWDLLKTRIRTSEFTSRVPVRTALSDFLATPGVGTGIYDREGVNVGESYTRTYTFVRTSEGGRTYNVGWVGNDGTFQSGSSVTLTHNRPVEFPVTIRPTSAGIHSAILNLDDPATAGVDYQTMNVVIAATRFTASGNYMAEMEGMIGRNQARHFFFAVPPNTPAFKLDFEGPTPSPGSGQARFLRYHPYGVPVDSNISTSCYQPPAGACATGTPLSRAVINPLPGVWEVTVEARRTSDAAQTPYTLIGSILGARVSPNPDIITPAPTGTPVQRTYTLTNLFGAFTGRAVGSTLGSARRGTFTIGNENHQEYDVVVTPGSTSLRVAIGSTSDKAADLDLMVFNCTVTPCVLAGQSADGDSEESVTINNPAAGRWQVRVDGFSVPSGSTTYSYLDLFVNQAFGAIAITDANALRAAGTAWTVPATITPNTAPGNGRVLYGNVEVRTDANVPVGSGEVILS